MNIAFTGGRNYNNYRAVEETMHLIGALRDDVDILVGCASGLDSLVRQIAKGKVTVFKANWNLHGKAAGPIRNGEMLESANLLIAFPGGKGTDNCIGQAVQLGIPVVYISRREND